MVPSFRCPFLPGMPSSLTTGSSIIVTVQNLDADTVFTESQPARRSLISRNPIHAGAHFRGFTGSQLLRPVRLLAPLDGSDWDTSPATGDFYFQASDGSVALPAAGYNYDSNWTPLCRRDLYGAFVVKLWALHDLFFLHFLCSHSFVRPRCKHSSAPTVDKPRRRAQMSSRPAVAPTSRQAPPLPGRVLTTSSTAAD